MQGGTQQLRGCGCEMHTLRALAVRLSTVRGGVWCAVGCGSWRAAAVTIGPIAISRPRLARGLARSLRVLELVDLQQRGQYRLRGNTTQHASIKVSCRPIRRFASQTPVFGYSMIG